MRNAMKNKDVQKIEDRLTDLSDDAVVRYNARFDNVLYVAAVGDNARRGVKLQDLALALCGDVMYGISWGNIERLTPAEARFLALFC
jgi:hypothetical protein